MRGPNISRRGFLVVAGLIATSLIGWAICRSPGPVAVLPASDDVPAPSSVKHDLIRLTQPFELATTPDGPPGLSPPPDRDRRGRSTAQFRAAVEQAWPSIALTDSAGQPSPIAVALDTAAGPIEITLFPDIAPNHVRNFLALTRVGYYDGLIFERTLRQEFVAAEDSEPKRVEVITAGCPRGDGEGGSDHLGYFLRPEPNALTHEPGTVGFVHTGDPNAACCRFYICLTTSPILDGQFTTVGKVTAGLDVVRAIAAQPTKSPNTAPESEQPQVPVVIRRAERK